MFHIRLLHHLPHGLVSRGIPLEISMENASFTSRVLALTQLYNKYIHEHEEREMVLPAGLDVSLWFWRI